MRREMFVQYIGKLFRIVFRNRIERRHYNNADISILSNTCIGGVMYHDLGQRFLSPTINLYIKPHDFIKFIYNLDFYFNEEFIEDVQMTSVLNYPVGKLSDIYVFFKHYETFEEAVKKWNERKKRIRYDKLYIIMTDRWCCPYEDLLLFQNAPYEKKICFTARDYPEFECCCEVLKDNGEGCVGIITNIENIFGKRLYQYGKDFNYIKFLNENPDPPAMLGERSEHVH